VVASDVCDPPAETDQEMKAKHTQLFQLCAELGCELTHIDCEEELGMIGAYCDNTQGYRKCKVTHVFAVDRHGEAERFAQHSGMGNHK